MEKLIISKKVLQEEIQKGFKTQLQELAKQLQPKEPNEYLTRSEVAKVFKVNLSTIHNWCKSGKLKPYGIGARVYFLRSDLRECLTPLTFSNETNNKKDVY